MEAQPGGGAGAPQRDGQLVGAQRLPGHEREHLAIPTGQGPEDGAHVRQGEIGRRAQDQLVRRLAPDVVVTDGGADDPRHPTVHQLRTAITATPASATAVADGTGALTTTVIDDAPTALRRGRRWLVAVPAAVVAGAAAVVLAAVVLSPSSPSGPRPAQADVLDITTEGDLVVARVSDPSADPARYAAEFAAHGLDVDLRLVPASPTAVGTVVYLEAGTGVEVIEAPDQCTTPGSGTCPVGIRIPAGHSEHIEVVFGRAAEPGETYQASNEATAAGEALAGLDVRGQRVTDVLDLLSERGQRAAQFRMLSATSSQTLELSADEVPGDWYVHSVSLWAPGEVMLFVGETPQPPVPPLPPGARDSARE